VYTLLMLCVYFLNIRL